MGLLDRVYERSKKPISQDFILIACCGKKRIGGSSYFSGSPVDSRLMEYRLELAKILKLSPGRDVGDINHDSSLTFMSAISRYHGNLYRAARLPNSAKNFKGKLIIISALYGVIDMNDPVREYQVTMKQRLPTGETIAQWWRKRSLGDIVANKLIGAPLVHNFLSLDYQFAVDGQGMKSMSSNIRLYNYSKLGSGSNYYRGLDILKLLKGD